MSILRKTLCIATVCVALVGSADRAFAKDVCTVNKDGDDGAYKSIAKALDDDCKNIRVDDGSYDGDITIGKGAVVRGDGQGDTTISGAVTMKDGAQLRDLTVKDRGGITIAAQARAVLSNVTVTGAKVGVHAQGGGRVEMTKVTVKNCGKGMYAQFGTSVSLKQCTITGNSEEGLDFRANTDGSVTGSTITNNGESGIEVILGRSNLVISGNTIKKNGASGIATQFYQENKKDGHVRITKNAITGNKSYGINCKKPSGGSGGSQYWEHSLSMTGNSLSGNGSGDFGAACKFAEETAHHATMTKREIKEERERIAREERKKQEALAAAQEQQKQSAAREAALEAKEQTTHEARKAHTAREHQQDQQGQEQEHVEQEQQNAHDHEVLAAVEAQLDEIMILQSVAGDARFRAMSQPLWRTLLFGPDRAATRQISESVVQQKQKIAQAEQHYAEISMLTPTDDVAARLGDVSATTQEFEDFLIQQRGRFSLFGWVRR